MTLRVATEQPLKLYITYAKQDSRFREELALHLAPLERQGVIEIWHDRLILPGQDRTAIVDARLEEADIILLLISPDFLASEYSYDIEVRRALERHKEGTAVVIPILLRPCFWLKSPLGGLQPLPANGRAIKLWSDRDSAWLDAVEGIYDLSRKQCVAPSRAVVK